jgi:hypothetical protein
MHGVISTDTELFIDRRSTSPVSTAPGVERRQFSNSYEGLTPEARDLAQAIDGYKLMHRRRFITYDPRRPTKQFVGFLRRLLVG